MDRIIFGWRLRTAYAFLVDGLAIESGPAHFKKQMREFLAANTLRQAVFSHSHEDHAGNVDLFNQLGITPLVHECALANLTLPPPVPLYRRIVWGNPASGKCRTVGSTIETDRHTFQVIQSPGHATDHICLYEENEGWLFTGDLYVGEKIIYLYDQEDIAALKKTLHMLSNLHFSVIFCSHRGPLQKGPDAFRRKLAYIEDLEEKAQDLQKLGLTPRKITYRLLGKEDYMYLISGGEFSKTAFINALLSQKK
ncbi:MBL fold metallo-hydrolase [Dethiobacter alkaliphilus]|nr:MBL fold metallo-hydrolase [Dethiobacter alkaliphilus]